MVPRDVNGFFARDGSSCLWFQIVGVETDLLLPDDQRDGGNLPRQGQARHRGLPSLGQQSLIEIAERSTTASDSCCCTLKDIFEVVVVVLIYATKRYGFLGAIYLSIDNAVLRTVMRF